MAQHSKNLSTLKAKTENYEIVKGINLNRLIPKDNVTKAFENQQAILNLYLHASDISSPAKKTKLAIKWTELIFVEFFEQGDIEKNSGYRPSLLCDRQETNIPKSQIGFISYVTLPIFEMIYNITPEAFPYLDNMKSNLRRNEFIVQEEHKKKSESK